MTFTYESLKSKNGRLIQERNIKKNFPQEYVKVLAYASEHGAANLHFSQKLWVFFHQSEGAPACKSCAKKVRWESYNYGYKTYCSIKCASNDNDWKNKRKATNLERYGVEEIGKSKKVQDKRKETMLEKHGVENPMQVQKFVDKIKETHLERYGVDNVMKLDKFQKKMMLTNKKNHGGVFNLNLQENRDKRAKKVRENFLKKFSDVKFLNIAGENVEISCDKCGNPFETYRGLFKYRYENKKNICTNCNPVGTQDSYIEQELREFVDSLGVEYVSNDREIIKPKELDILVPEKGVAIELNGLFWHCDKYVDDMYHLHKTLACAERGYKLLHVFEDEWVNKREIVKSIVRNQLGLTEKKIYARKCKIVEISTEKARKFLTETHIQGYTGARYKYALEYEGEIVAVSTFAALRKNMGQKAKEGHYEIIRYANNLNTTVVGGASRLFKHFIRQINPTCVISYANRRFFSGAMYKTLGMVKTGESKPNYFYINGSDLKRRGRFQYRKDILVSQGYDKKKTEREIMNSLGFHRIYDCGTHKYQWTSD